MSRPDEAGPAARARALAPLIRDSADEADRERRLDVVPEPGTGLLVASGLIAVGSRSRRAH